MSGGPYLFDVSLIALAHAGTPVSEPALQYVRQAVEGQIDAVVPHAALIGAQHTLRNVYEELYDEAIERAETSGGPSVIESVVEAVSDQRPDWAVKACETQAEPIIENGQHDRYRTAVR